MKIISFTFILLTYNFLSAQIIVTLQPGADEGIDTKIWSVENIVNFGDFEELRAMEWTWFGEEGTERSLLRFNLANIPINAEICYARLSLYRNDSTSSQTNSSLSGPNVTILCRVITPWEENLVTWDSQPSITMTNHATIPESVLPFEDVTDIDVTDLVADMIADPANSFGFELRLETEEYYRRRVFATSDNPDSTRHPKLEICYSLPVNINNYSTDAMVVYPNPIRQGELHITTNIANGLPMAFAIFNNMGQLVYEESQARPDATGVLTLSSTITAQLLPGNYLVRVNGMNGSQTAIFNKAD